MEKDAHRRNKWISNKKNKNTVQIRNLTTNFYLLVGHFSLPDQQE